MGMLISKHLAILKDFLEIEIELLKQGNRAKTNLLLFAT